MRHPRHRPPPGLLALALPALLLTAAPGSALGDPYLGGCVGFAWELYRDSSPTPFCMLYADEGYAEGLVFHRTKEFLAMPCLSSWLAHCDGDSLHYRGQWPEVDPLDPLWDWNRVTVTLVARLLLDEPTRLTARRSVAGALQTAVHEVRVVPAADPELVMLGAGTEDAAEIVLQPGLHDVVLAVEAVEHGTHWAYAAEVHVAWAPETGVPRTPHTWGAVKSLYR